MAIYVKKWNGSVWVDSAVKKWDGGSWVDAYTYKWNGSNWVQIYPEQAISTTQTITGGSTTWTYREKVWQNWKQEDAKQGNCTYSSSTGRGDSANYGYLDLTSQWLPGHGNINSVSSAYFSGTRGASGQYGSSKTIKFYRGHIVPTAPGSASPVGTIFDQFTCTSGANGSGGPITEREISSLNTMKLWMNGTSGKNKLYIYSNLTNDYLSIRGASTMKMSYVYIASSATFSLSSYDASPAAMTYDLTSEKTTSFSNGMTLKSKTASPNAYHNMLIYPEEINMSLDEIFKYREENNLEDIDTNDLLTDYIKQISLKDFDIDYENNIVNVEMDGFKDNHKLEYSIDGDNYQPMSSSSIDKYTGDLTSEFDKNRDNVYIRVIDTVKDSIDFEYMREPLFLVS